MATPSPLTWTLRLKSHKTTILLHTDPLSSFTTLKTHLYTALEETHSIYNPETGATLPLPSSPSAIQLGRPVNVNDPGEGFEVGEWEVDAGGELEDGDASGKGKGKAKAGTSSGGGAKDCPKGAGLKDGSVLAFRWVGDGVWDGGDADAEEDKMWGVKLASFEDAYGVENGMDVGGGRMEG